MKNSEHLNNIGSLGLAFLLYLVAAIGFTWPLITDMSGRVLGYIGFENTAQTLWIFHAWYTYQINIISELFSQYGWLAPLTHWGEFYHLCMSFPERNSVANGLDFFWTWPLYKLFGFPAYYNVKCLIILALNGLSAMLLARTISTNRLATFVAGFFYAFNPYHFYLIITGRIIEIQTFLPIFAIYALITTWDKDSVWRWATAGALLGLVTDNYWFYGHFTIIFVLVFLVFKLCTKQPPRLGPSWRNLVIYLFTFLVVVLPFAHPYLVRLAVGQRIPGMVRPDPQNSQSMTSLTRQMIAFSADADYPIRQQPQDAEPSPYAPPWWGPWQCTFLTNALIIGLFPALILRRQWFWILGTFIFYLLPLGPFLKYGCNLVEVQGQAIPLPYLYLIEYYPLIAKLFWPNQSMFLFAICLTMLIGSNLDYLFSLRALHGKTLISGLIAVSILTIPAMEMRQKQQLPLPQDSLTIPPLYLNEGRDQGYIFLPIGRRYWETFGDFNRDYYHGADVTVIDMHLAMSHGRGLFGRPHYMAHKDYWLYNPYSLTTQPFLRWLVSLGVRDSYDFSASDQQQIVDEGYRYLVVHERICCHLQLEKTNRTDLENGRKIFDSISAELQKKYGDPVYKGTETSWDQNIENSNIIPIKYRINIYEIKPKATAAKTDSAAQEGKAEQK